MIACSIRRFDNFIKGLKWPVLYDKRTGKSMVVCNLYSHGQSGHLITVRESTPSVFTDITFQFLLDCNYIKTSISFQ